MFILSAICVGLVIALLAVISVQLYLHGKRLDELERKWLYISQSMIRNAKR